MQNIIFILTLTGLIATSCQGQRKSTQLISFVDTAKVFKKVIPTYDDGKLELFYLLAKDKQKQLGLDSMENGVDNLQIRVWYDYSRVKERELIIISNKATLWTATIYTLHVDWDGETERIISKEIKQATPKSGWPEFLNKLLDLQIVTLPNMHDISDYPTTGKDGRMYNVEIATKKLYRFYGYWEPQEFANRFWQANNMRLILELFKNELGV